MDFYSKYKIKHFQRDIEPHEIFLDKLAKAKEEESGLTEKKIEVPLKEKISHILLVIFLLFALILFSKTFYLQIVEGKKLYIISENNKRRIALIIPERGIIYDKNLKKLVSNSPAFDLVCDKRRFSPSVAQTLKEIKSISDLTSRDFEELKKEIEESKDSKVLIYENISHEKLLVFEANINDFSGCQIEKNTVRDYVFSKSFSHVLGYTGKISKNELENYENYAVNDYIGKTGIEAFYEEFLRGKPGAIEEIKSAIGIEKGEKTLSQIELGKNLVLNIDSGFQEKLYSALEDGIKKVGAKRGAAVAMDPSNGAVLAMVSYPSYDNNLFSKGILQKDFDKIQNDISKPLFDRAIAAQYSIGSTIKPFIALAALQEEIISPVKQINDKGYIEVRSKYDPSIVYKFSGIKPHGLVDMRKAIAVSSNIYFYTVGGGYEDQQGLGPTRIKKYLELFGWSEKTGIDIPGEFSGFVPSPEWKKQKKKEPWWDGDTYNLSIGQSDLQITPLQVAMAYSAIANGGTLYKPQIAQKIIDISTGSPEIIKEFKPEIIRKNFIDPENLQIVRQGMRDGVLYGSSVSLNGLPVKVASKTGTVEIPDPDRYNAWISAFAPYENPEIVLVITIESVEGIRAAVLPIARDVLNWYFTR
ncbi:MAG: penicillin-binding protein 2 [Parcubacteria group bacterium Licking1014_1]|nr:MAG: penicillin-binding protein 2 [Parcubacteria group bacterium Licking1014_1]